ncbi:MAG: hypothetical protein ABJN69_09400 [Hellea sp.]
MAVYDIYISGAKHSVTANPTDQLSSLRGKLGKVSDNYGFVYFDEFTKKKTILQDRSLENKPISSIVFNKNVIIMSVVKGGKTDLFGSKVDWFKDRQFGIRVIKNTADPAAVASNKGKFDPIMLTDVEPSNQTANVFYQRVVICQKGTVIQFNMSSWGAAGFGYSIKSDKDTICDSLYICFGDKQNRIGNGSLRRYEKSQNTIVVDSTQSQDIGVSDIIHYQKITAKSWRLRGYKQNGKIYATDQQALEAIAPSAVFDSATGALTIITSITKTISGFFEGIFGGRSTVATKSVLKVGAIGFDHPGPGGGEFIPGGGIESGTAMRGGTGGGTFGSISDIVEDDKNTTVQGSVLFYFLVFESADAANQVINALNTPQSRLLN